MQRGAEGAAAAAVIAFFHFPFSFQSTSPIWHVCRPICRRCLCCCYRQGHTSHSHWGQTRTFALGSKLLQLSAVICRKCWSCSKQSPNNTTASPSSKGLHLRNGSELNLRSDCRQAVEQAGKHFSAQKVLMMDAVSDPAAAPAHSVTHSIDHNITGKCVCGCQWQSAPVNSCSSNLSWDISPPFPSILLQWLEWERIE